MSERFTRKDLVARANKFGLDVETHSPGGSGTYYTFGTPEIFKPPTRTIGRTHTEHGLAKADSFLDGFIFAQMMYGVGPVWGEKS